MRHIIATLVENKFGVLARIAGLFSARGYNIASLAVSETLDPGVSYLTMVVEAEDEKILEQINKQLNKLIDVLTVTDFTNKEHVDRELVILRVGCASKDMSMLENIVKKDNANIIQQKADGVILEFVGGQGEVKKLIDDLKPFGIKELARSGRIAMAK